MKRTSKIFALLLAVLMVVAIIPFSAITAFAVEDPAFTVQPQNATADPGEKATVTWELNFEPVILRLTKVKGSSMSNIDIPLDATSVEIEPTTEYDYYYIIAYYEPAKFIPSKAFYVTETGELLFVDSNDYNVPKGYTGTEIDEIDLSDAVSGGTAPYTFSKESGPDWLNVSADGKITGTRPSESSAADNAVIKVTDSASATKQISIVVYDVSFAIQSIEIEAVEPTDGVTADISTVKVVRVNGEESLADKVSFMEDTLYWVEVPSLDPSEWGTNWTKFTGTFEEGGIYSLHFTLQSDLAVAESCEITVTDPDGETWWSGDIASQDATYVVVDAVVEAGAAYEVINSVEITLDREIVPVAGQPTPISQFMNVDVAVNGSTSKSSLISDMYLDWYFNDVPFEYNEGERFLSLLFWSGYYYNCEICLELDGDNVFANEVDFKVNTPTKTYEFTVDGYEDYSYCYGYIRFEEKTAGEPLKAVGDIDITVGTLTEGMRADELSINVGGENVQYVSGYDNGYNAYSGYCLYNHTDECDLEADDVIEKGKVYEIRLRIESKPGYTLADFSRTYANVSVNGIDPTFVEYRNLPMKEYIRVIATLPYILDNGQQITAPSMNYAGYADGANVSDVTVGVTSSALQLAPPMFPGEPMVFEVEGDEDEYIEKHEKFTLPVYLNVAPGFLVDGITKDMFIMNGMKPTFLWLDYSWSEGCPQICLVYELPVFHELGGEWQSDKDNHWKLCECGEEVEKAAHEDTDNNGKCDSCSYLLVDVTPIYDVKLILNNYAVGKKVSDINVIVPAGAKYKVVSFEVYDIMSGNPCAPTDVIEIDKGYIIDVELEAELGYKIIEELNSLMNMCPNVTLNGIMGYRDGWNCFRFFMPDFATSTTPYPKGEIKLNGYQLGVKAEDVTVTMPNGYEMFGGIGSGFMFFDAYTEGVITEFGTGFYVVSIVFYPNSDYDSSTFSKDTLTLCGQEAEFVMQTPMNYQVTYYLPLAPAATDAKIEKVEVSLNGYGIGVHTSAVTVTANDYTGIDVLEGCFIEDSIIWTELEGGIEAGKKYLYQVGIAASEGFTLSSIRPETFTLNGKTPVDFYWEEGFLIAVFETDALGTTPEPGTTPGTNPDNSSDTPDNPGNTPDDPSDDKDGLGAGAIVAIVIGSVAVAGVGGFCLYWFVIRKKKLTA